MPETPFQHAAALLIDAVEFSQLLGIGRSTFFALVSCGRIGPEPIRLGKRRLYQRAEVEAWVAAKCPPRRLWEGHRAKNV